jgi:hypothetical protein
MLKILLVIVSIFSSQLYAGEKSKIERIGGNFLVHKISKSSSGAFIVEFRASEGAPKFKELRLESDNINAALVEGTKLRLSADVTRVSGRMAEVAQVVVYLPGAVGSTPIWMLSKKAPRLDPPAKLLEMHAPVTDFAVF